MFVWIWTAGEGTASTTYIATKAYIYEDYRGQSYDNGANMKGKKKGVRARLLQINPRAMQVPCAAHTLNLVVGDAAKSSADARYHLKKPCQHNTEILIRYQMGESGQKRIGCKVPDCRSQRCTSRGEGQSLPIEELTKQCETLSNTLSFGGQSDLDGKETALEMQTFPDFSKANMTTLELLAFLQERKLKEVYPNMWVALRIALTIPVTVAAAERSFSKLKLIKTYLDLH